MAKKQQRSLVSNESRMAVGRALTEAGKALTPALLPSDRKPLMLGGRMLDLNVIENYGRNGLDEQIVLKLLRIPLSAMDSEPEAAQEFRMALEYGTAQLADQIQTASIQKAIGEGDTAMLKFLAGAYGAKPLQDKSKQAVSATSDAQSILNGLVRHMLENRQNEVDQQKRAIAEERARMMGTVVTEQPPIVGDIHYTVGTPVSEIEPDAEVVERLESVSQAIADKGRA